MVAPTLSPGTVVSGPFFSDRSLGVGIIVRRSRDLWTQAPEGYVAVRVVLGDRCSGGYQPEGLTELPTLKAA